MGMPKWEYPGCTHMKIKIGPKWDQHGNAQVGMPRCIPHEKRCGSHGGTNMGMPKWACPSVSHVKNYVGPIWACPNVSRMNINMGPK